jgi:hypothetical protein
VQAPAPPALPAPSANPPSTTITAPSGTPITITITNNNTNTNTNPVTSTNTNDNGSTATATATAAPSAAPGASIAYAPRSVIEHYELERTSSSRWLTVGLVTNGERSDGVRASVDLIGRGAWTFGVAATLTGGEHGREKREERRGDSGAGAVAYIAYTRTLGPLQMRAQVGLGASVPMAGEMGREGDNEHEIARTTGDGRNGRAHQDLSPRAEAALLFALPLGKHVGLVAGPVVTADEQRAEASAFGGLRFGF